MFDTINTAQIAQLVTSFRTTTPSTPATTDTTTKQVDPLHVHEILHRVDLQQLCTFPQVDNSGLQSR